MRPIKSIALLLLTASVVLSSVEVETNEKDGSAKDEEDDHQDVSKLTDEPTDETFLEDLKHLYEQLRELKMLQDSMLKFVPTSDAFDNNKSFKDRKGETRSKSKDSETKESTPEDFHVQWTLEEEEVEIVPEEEPPEPLNPQQQEGELLRLYRHSKIVLY